MKRHLHALVVLATAASVAVAPLPAAAQPTAAQVRLPALGETAADDFSAGTERRLGEQIMADIVRDPDFLDDPVLVEYLQSLWLPLVASARQRGEIDADIDQQFAWEAFLVRDRTVNAFALPGGWVGVHLGLIAMTATRDELASVLAHELSHVTQRHIARSIGNSQRASLAGIAGAILAVLAASRSNNADLVQAAMIGGQAVAIQGQLNFSRDMEREADRIGFGVLTGAGFAPAGMAAMFDKLDSANRLNDNGAFPYLRSHPLTVDRISEARSRLLFAAPSSGAVAPQLLHRLMQARARVLMDPSVQSLRRLQEPLSGPSAASGTERIGQLYAGALASALLRDHGMAQAAVQQAMTLVANTRPHEQMWLCHFAHPPRGADDVCRRPGGSDDAPAERYLQLLQAQVALVGGDAALAVQTLDRITLEPQSRAPMMLRAQAALDWQRQGGAQAAPAAAELRRSTEALQTWVSGHKRDGMAWSLLSATAEAIGLRLRALRANAEARAAEGDLNGAIDRLRAAQQAARTASVGQDFIEASIIDARLRALQGQRRQLALEARGNRGAQHPEGEPTPQ